MAAPSYRDNSNPPAVRFIKKNGRVIPIVQGKKVNKASGMIESRLDEMSQEVQMADRGERGVGYNDDREVVRNFSTKSTYPKFYSEIGFKNKDHFYKTVMTRETKLFDKLADQAIDDLKDGYDTSFGRVPPSRDFRVATRQTFDNRGVVFRKIDGQIRPLRFKKKNDEVPF